MANEIIDNNFLLNTRAADARTLLNAASRLRLYATNKAPTPADTLASYAAIEATFDTYVIKTLTAGWGAQAKIIDGLYRLLSTTATYGSPATTGNTLYGLFVDDAGGNLLFAFQFDTAIVYSVGAPALSIQLAYEVWAAQFGP